MLSGDLKDFACAMGIVLVLAFILMLLGGPVSEGFTNSGRCDVDNPCAPGLKCVNGFCAQTDPKPLVDPTPVPLLPAGGPAPYF
jgi:hypothetical protein